jgi:alpha-glucosidase
MYQGEELGLPEAELRFEDLRDPFGITYYPEFRGRDGSRTPMPWDHDAPHAGFTHAASKPWLPIPDAHRVRAADAQKRDPGSLLNHWRRFLHWRKRQPALIEGDIRLIDVPAPFLAFARTHSAQRLLVIFNFDNQTAELPLAMLPKCKPLDGHGFASAIGGGLLAIPGRSVFFGAIENA